MSTNMLGNSAMLRKLWCGPLADLMIKLTGQDGARVQEGLAMFLRGELSAATVVAVPETKEGPVKIVLPLKGLQFPVEELFGPDTSGWQLVFDEEAPELVSTGMLDISRVRLVPAPPRCISIMVRGDLTDNHYPLLGPRSFMACWLARDGLPHWWRDLGNIFFDGFCIQEPHEHGESFNAEFQWAAKLYYEDGMWKCGLNKTCFNVRETGKDCSAVYS